MDKIQFKEFLYNQIPITKIMGINIIQFDDLEVKISAELKPNINHKSTAFGGSINSLMTICGWSMVFKIIKQIDINTHIVIKKSNISYIAPIQNDFIAKCYINNINEKEMFIEGFEKYGKAKLDLKVECFDGEILAAKFEGQYVVFK